ncbi:MAG: hypothetical protein NXI16_17420 [Alphaproteobacteria bacterium]|nr:hypothetical protein [Alphaproteobacteria bacterium]
MKKFDIETVFWFIALTLIISLVVFAFLEAVYEQNSYPFGQGFKNFGGSFAENVGVILGVPTSLAGSIVAIVLAKRALSLSLNQNHIEQKKIIQSFHDNSLRSILELRDAYEFYNLQIRRCIYLVQRDCATILPTELEFVKFRNIYEYDMNKIETCISENVFHQFDQLEKARIDLVQKMKNFYLDPVINGSVSNQKSDLISSELIKNKFYPESFEDPFDYKKIFLDYNMTEYFRLLQIIESRRPHDSEKRIEFFARILATGLGLNIAREKDRSGHSINSVRFLEAFVSGGYFGASKYFSPMVIEIFENDHGRDYLMAPYIPDTRKNVAEETPFLDSKEVHLINIGAIIFAKLFCHLPENEYFSKKIEEYFSIIGGTDSEIDKNYVQFLSNSLLGSINVLKQAEIFQFEPREIQYLVRNTREYPNYHMVGIDLDM